MFRAEQLCGSTCTSRCDELGPTGGMLLAPLGGFFTVLGFLEPPLVLGGLLAVLRLGAGAAAGAGSAVAAVRRLARVSGILGVL